ncbi:MAG: 5'-nucleotidase C-terminal domain-containing protein, partial [Candidatus Acidiferrales bacterium]
VSLASLFSTRTRWAAGPVTLRDVYSLYFYENKLFTVEITGRQLKDALEYSARSFATYPWPEGAVPFSGWGYNFDMAQGVTYKIDLSRPPGERIADLRFEGAPLDPARKLTLALNSYRWSGGGGYDMLRHAKIVGRAKKQVREAIIDYLSSRLTVETDVDHNWEIVPQEARRSLLDWVQPTTSTSLHAAPAGIGESSLTTTAAVP